MGCTFNVCVFLEPQKALMVSLMETVLTPSCSRWSSCCCHFVICHHKCPLRSKNLHQTDNYCRWYCVLFLILLDSMSFGSEFRKEMGRERQEGTPASKIPRSKFNFLLRANIFCMLYPILCCILFK